MWMAVRDITEYRMSLPIEKLELAWFPPRETQRFLIAISATLRELVLHHVNIPGWPWSLIPSTLNSFVCPA